MKIAHVSDTHGRFPALGNAEVVVHSGDFCPNIPRPRPHDWDVDQERQFQLAWISRKEKEISEWLQGRPLLICSGNHDFLDVGEVLSSREDAYSLNMRRVEYGGKIFVGFPYIPYLAGEWAGELRTPEMDKAVQEMLNLLEGDKLCDILVSHSPPAGILDRGVGKGGGITQLSNALAYEVGQLPEYLLCGHFHECPGEEKFDSMRVINSATIVTHIVM